MSMYSTPPAKPKKTPPPTVVRKKTDPNKGNSLPTGEINGNRHDEEFCRPSAQSEVKSEAKVDTVKKRDCLTLDFQELKAQLIEKNKPVPVINVPSKSLKSSMKSNKTTSSSIAAKKKKLELEAAQAKARIQMDLIDKKLAADLAAVEDKYSSQTSESDHESAGRDIEQWLEDSQQELEKQRANGHGTSKRSKFPPGEAGTDGPVQQLVSAMKELITTSASHKHDANLLSRISTPKELPLFFGDPLEWLAFKQAYEESTSLCNFTNKENLWRLRKCLRGSAKEAVSALLISATSPDIVMSTLELQYGNPDVILTRIMSDIKKLSPLPQEYHKDIVPFSIKVKNFVAAVRALQRDEYLQGVNVANIVLSKLPTVLLSKWSDYSYPLIKEGRKFRLDILSDFLNEEAVKISISSANLINIRVDNKRKFSDNSNQSQTVLLQSTHKDNKNEEKCRFCRVSKHKLTDCKKFKKSLRKDRWAYVKRAGLCYKCLLSHHDRQTCPAAACGVDSCAEPHHRLLHYVPSSRQNNSMAEQTTQTDNTAAASPQQENVQSEIISHIKSNSCYSVFLKVVKIYIQGPNGVISASALLDDGSTVSLISASLAARAGLRGRKQPLHVRGAFNNTELVCDTEAVDLMLSNKQGHKYKISARSVNVLNLPEQNLTAVNCDKYYFLREIKDNLCIESLKPEVLIGQDNYHLLVPLETVTGNPNEPCATRTPLGWCIHGRIMCAPKPACAHSTLFIANDVTAVDDPSDLYNLHEEVRRSFSIEAMGVSATKPRQNAEDQRAWDILEQTSTLEHGKWHVGLPWKDENCVMPDSYPNAMARLKGVEQKMKKDEKYAARYKERVQHLLDNDYAEELKKFDDTPKTWYLPHFGVDNLNKKKLRLVFDAAAKSSGTSLNDYLLKGPDLLMSLFGIMLRFRENKIAVTGDIKDMFLRVKIRNEDRDALRFIFRGNPTDDTRTKLDAQYNKKPLKIYVMTSLIFGANCSPFIAQFVKNKNARRFESTMPSAAAAIYSQHYMDDYIDSLPDEQTAKKLIQQISYIHSQGNFEIRNWNSNSKEVLSSVPKETLGEAAVKFKIDQRYQGERTLGLIWHTFEDTLGFDVSFKRIPEKIINGSQVPTKREMLRVVMSIFDVYGFLSPFTINGKIILQETWQTNIDWDDQVNDKIYSKWKQWICLLQSLRNVRLPRYYQAATSATETERGITSQPSCSHLCGSPTAGAATLPPPPVLRDVAVALPSTPTLLPVEPTHAPCVEDNNSTSINCYTNLQMHIFCDASTKAICAVAYWRWIDNNGSARIAFIASKCRVAGNKPITVPRLELQAAVLAARLADSITKEHKMIAQRRYFWSDSTTVLHWIRNNTRNYKIYVANRLGEIDDLTKSMEWRYIPTKMNIADIATRESYDSAILQQEWLYGPTFLKKNENDWPQDVTKPETDKNILECVTILQTQSKILPVPDPSKYSSWLRLLKTTYRILTFVDKGMMALKRKYNDKNYTYNLDDSRMERAERLLIQYSQQNSFSSEIMSLNSSKIIPTTSKLLTLSPYLDEHGVLRAGGRIDAATDVSPEIKRPAILDGRDYITRLIVRHYHVTAAHGYQEMVVNNLKQKYWIIKMRPTVKNVVAKCMLCKLKKCKPEVPRMGDLPEARMAHHQRPFSFCGVDLFGPMEVTVGRRHQKRYGVLFTCLTIRAIHIEIVQSLTSDSFIMALRRMAARRGWPLNLYSDNGTNLRGAHTELTKAIQDLDEQTLSDQALNHGTKWTFIPPSSPHWGGAWERLIRSVKTSLKVVLKERAPREETLITLLAEIENMINSRPLTHVTVEAGTLESLTPNHFLLGSSSNLPQIGIFDNTDFYLRKQWRISQRLADLFWNRWVREVLPDMIPRKKWNKEQKPLKVDDLVYIVDPDSPRNVWPKGIIKEVCPGKDGRVRMVKIKTKTGLLTRSAGRVARVPIREECC